MVVKLAVAFEFANYRTDDIIDPPPISDTVPLEKSPIVMPTISIEKYILRWMYIHFFEPGRSTAIDGSRSDKIKIILSKILISLDADRIWEKEI